MVFIQLTEDMFDVSTTYNTKYIDQINKYNIPHFPVDVTSVTYTHHGEWKHIKFEAESSDEELDKDDCKKMIIEYLIEEPDEKEEYNDEWVGEFFETVEVQ